MRSIITSAVAALLVLLPVVGAQAEDKAAGTKYEAAKGLYVYGGFAVAKTNFSGSLDPNLGFNAGAGYRFLPWLGADADLYWGGRDQGNFKTRQFGLTFNAKAYPLGLISPKTLDFLQPYMVVGMGGGNFKFKNGTDIKDGTFIFRLGAGADWMLTDHIGLYTDVSLNTTGGLFAGNTGGATGVYTLGGKFTF